MKKFDKAFEYFGSVLIVFAMLMLLVLVFDNAFETARLERYKEPPMTPYIQENLDTGKSYAQLANEEWEMSLPEDPMERYNLVIEGDKDYSSGIQNFLNMPEPILKKWIKLGWSLEFGDTYIDKYNEELGRNADGLTYVKQKKIYVSNPDAVCHEIGHFLDFISAFQEKDRGKLYSEEAESASSILGLYSLTNSEEYFAESFDYYIKNLDDEAKIEAFREVAPKTVQRLEYMQENNWGISLFIAKTPQSFYAQ